MSHRLLLIGSVLGLLAATPVSAKVHKPVMTAEMMQQAQAYLKSAGVLQTTAPSTAVTRGEFIDAVTKLLYKKDLNITCFQSLGSYPEQEYTKLFSDVDRNHVLANSLCVALKVGIAKGNPDGSFGPNAPLRASEASWIVYKAYDLGPAGRENIAGSPWYDHFLYDVDQTGVMPTAMRDPAHKVTLAESTEMLFHLKKHQTRLLANMPKEEQMEEDEIIEETEMMTEEATEVIPEGYIKVRVHGKDMIVPKPKRRN